jgi:hypothetical protein
MEKQDFTTSAPARDGQRPATLATTAPAAGGLNGHERLKCRQIAGHDGVHRLYEAVHREDVTRRMK